MNINNVATENNNNGHLLVDVQSSSQKYIKTE